MLRFQSFLSGSSGNCTLISDGETHLLVDCGATGKYISECLRRIGIQPGELSGILVTHEHRDHTCGVGVMSRKYDLRVVTNELTFEGMRPIIGEIREQNVVLYEPEKEFEIGGIGVKMFSIPHDAANPVGYSFTAEGEKFCIATDTGHITESMMENLAGSTAAILESNHDVEMLKNGSYPYPLKKRILSDHGHLSNENCGKLCLELAGQGTRCFWLGHLSEENNLPELAYGAVATALTDGGAVIGGDVSLGVLARYWIG